MANTNSSIITGVGDPASMSNVGIMGGRVRIAMDVVNIASAPADGDTITLCRLPSSCRILSVKLFNDDIDTIGTEEILIDLGLVDTDGTGGDPDVFLDGDDALQDANTAGLECRFGTAAADIDAATAQAWELADKTSDDGKQLDLILTIPTDAGTFQAGHIMFQVLYVLD